MKDNTEYWCDYEELELSCISVENVKYNHFWEKSNFL